MDHQLDDTGGEIVRQVGGAALDAPDRHQPGHGLVVEDAAQPLDERIELDACSTWETLWANGHGRMRTWRRR